MLTGYGLKNNTGSYFSLRESNYSSTYHPDKDAYVAYHHLVNWLNVHEEALRQAGFQVEQELTEATFFLGRPELAFEVKEHDKDWFDVYARVYFGEYAIPFIRLKQNILKGIREYTLPSGEIAVLPEEWFNDYLEFLQFSKEDGQEDILQLQKHHYNLIKDIGNQEKGIGKDYLESLKKLDSSEKEEVQLPETLNVTLRDYQKEGYAWLQFLKQNRFGGCLADDMGLGKTLQTLAVLLKDKEESGNAPVNWVKAKEGALNTHDEENTPEKGTDTAKNKRVNLIIMPSSLIHNWRAEILKFTPGLSCLQYTGTDRSRLLKDFYKYDILLTTYGMVRNDIEALTEFRFNYIILDESQVIKNPASKTAKVVKRLVGDHKLVLTGTPIENSLTDLWSQMSFLNPGLLGSYRFFKREYVHPVEKKRDEAKREKLRVLIKPFLLRRTKEEVAKELPSLMEKVHYCEMSEAQEKEYERIKSYYRNQIMENIEQFGFNKSQFMILKGLTQLRLASNHPALINADFEDESGKFNEIIRKVENVTNENHKILIFSQFVMHLNFLKEHFEREGIGYAMLTGSTKKREDVINQFRKDPEKRVFLISLKAGGVGLNLVEADYVFITDPWWNPATESQAINRAHRIGQDKNVISYKFITRNTIEEKILKLQEKKSELVRDIIQANQNIAYQLTKEDLEMLLN